MRTAYPRPELVRDSYTSLCGEWEFEFDFGKTGKARGVQNKSALEKTILVPFCPESDLSGIGYRDFIGACWYRKTLHYTPAEGMSTLLNFEAAFHTTEVFVNGTSVGVHRGGYTPFSFDLAPYLTEGDNSIAVLCEGDSRSPFQPSGKQSEKFESYNCMYRRTTGIYAPVWMETVPKNHLERIKLDPDIDNSRLFCELTLSEAADTAVTLVASLEGKTVGTAVAKTTGKQLKTVIDLDTLALWSPDSPTLYDLSIEIASGGMTDRVTSYFGMRKVELDGVCLRINGKRIFQRLVLDQGYYPDGIYTASDDGDFKRDIEISMRVGFNGARLHQRVFERRFLYEADRLGYLVWGEYADWGLDHTRDDVLACFLPEWNEAVARDYNHPALIGWCPFNETWDIEGRKQCDALVREVYYETKRLDPFRPVIDTSGNYHVVTDIYDTHDYCQKIDSFHERYDRFEDGKIFDARSVENYKVRQTYKGEPFFLSEYGGIKWSNAENGWGYGNAPKTIEEYTERFVSMIEILRGNPLILGVCYTQLYDVEQEQNGIYNFDRSPKFEDSVMDTLAAAMSGKAAVEEE